MLRKEHLCIHLVQSFLNSVPTLQAETRHCTVFTCTTPALADDPHWCPLLSPFSIPRLILPALHRGSTECPALFS
jgi:hypothetical protein